MWKNGGQHRELVGRDLEAARALLRVRVAERAAARPPRAARPRRVPAPAIASPGAGDIVSGTVRITARASADSGPVAFEVSPGGGVWHAIGEAPADGGRVGG